MNIYIKEQCIFKTFWIQNLEILYERNYLCIILLEYIVLMSNEVELFPPIPFHLR